MTSSNSAPNSTIGQQEDTLSSIIAEHIMDQSPAAAMNPEAWWPTWDKDYTCESLDASLYKKQGCILQFYNNNAGGMAGMIGGMRIALTDVRRMPKYISKNKGHIKNVAIKLLTAHLIESQCAAGAGESLSQEDYGISFSVASLSQNGLRLHPTNRQEGPLFFCLFDGLMEPVVLSRNQDNQVVDSAYIINVYINLLPPTQRRITVLKKQNDDAKVEASADPPTKKSKAQDIPAKANQQMNQNQNPSYQENQGYQGYQGTYPNNIRPYQGQGGYQNRYPPQPQGPSGEDLAKQMVSMQNSMEEKFKVLEAKQIPLPALPQPSAPIWPTVSIALPDE